MISTCSRCTISAPATTTRHGRTRGRRHGWPRPISRSATRSVNYGRALEAARHLDGLSVTDRVETLEAVGDLHERMGRYDHAAARFTEARRLVPDDPVAQGRLCFKHSMLAERSGSYTQAVRWLRRGLRGARRQPRTGRGSATRHPVGLVRHGAAGPGSQARGCRSARTGDRGGQGVGREVGSGPRVFLTSTGRCRNSAGDQRRCTHQRP